MQTKKLYKEQLLKDLSFVEGFSFSKPQYEILEAFKKMSLLKTKKERVQVIKELLVACQKEMKQDITKEELGSLLFVGFEKLCLKSTNGYNERAINLLFMASLFFVDIYKLFCKKMNFPLPEPVSTTPLKSDPGIVIIPPDKREKQPAQPGRGALDVLGFDW